MILLRATLAGIALIIAACQPLQRPAPDNLYSDDHWQVSGKLALRARGEAIAGKRHQTLQFHWLQYGEDYRLKLSGALGFGQVLVASEQGQLSLYRGGKIIASADSAEQLLQDTTGWTLPVSLLRYWATGRPAPDQPHSALDESGQNQIPGFSQAGWVINYPGESSTGLSRPSKLRAEHPQLRLVAAFKDWEPAPRPQ